MKLNPLLIICLLTCSLWSSISEAKSFQELLPAIHRVKKAVDVEPSGDTHDHDHGDEAQVNCAVTEHILADEFSKLAVELSLVGNDGTVCKIEDEHHEEGEGHEDEDHHDEDEDHHEDDDDHGSSAETNSCETYFEFVQQLLIRLNVTAPCCFGNASNCEDEPAGSSRTPAKEAYGYGFLMVLLISLCSLLGVLFVPLLNKKNSWGKILYQYIYALMIALGASALFCDAILHLIPLVFGLHGHSAEEDSHEHGEEEEDMSFIWKGCVVIGGLYFFFLFEFILHTWNSHTHHHHDDSTSTSGNSTPFLLESQKNDDDLKMKKVEENCTEPELTFPHGECKDSSKQNASILHPANGDGRTGKTHSGDEHDSKTSKSCPKKICSYIFNIKPLAWLILLGDGVHNFADGLALGAAISQSLSLGIGTMIAIVFHEIPHEIGDFVILISTGMTWYAALLFNFFSALLAIVGFFVGVAVSVESSEANEWILAAAAGLFIYIALVDLLPELIHLKQKGCLRWGLFLVLNVGFFISFVVLLLLAIYEDQLNDLVKV